MEGAAASPEIVKELRKFPGMTVWEPSAALNDSRKNSRIWGEKWLGNFFNKPCNNELFVRQSLNMEIAIATAQKQRIDWHGRAVQVDPIKPTGTKRLKLNYFAPLSSFAFKFNLRRYITFTSTRTSCCTPRAPRVRCPSR